MLKKLRRFMAVFLLLGGLIWGYVTYRQVSHVLSYRALVREVLAEHPSSNNQTHENLVLAMIYTETKGEEDDVMQASESWSGTVNSITDTRSSVRQGVAVLSENFALASSHQVDDWTAIQAYNFGAPYITYVAQNGGVNSLAVAKQYSRDILAPSLGNTTGETYSYNSLLAFFNGDRKLYQNGGNYYYSRQVQVNLYLVKLFSYLTEVFE